MSLFRDDQHHLLLTLLLHSFLLPSSLAIAPSPSPSSLATLPMSLPRCSDRCGDVHIPYPFGIENGCFLDEHFKVTCDDEEASKTAPFYGDYHILSVSLDDGSMRVLTHVAVYCHHNKSRSWLETDKSLDKFYFSAARNKFTGVGCDTVAFLLEPANNSSVGCFSICNKEDSVLDGVCEGGGCCQTSDIPPGLQNITLFVRSFNNDTGVENFNPCSYAFLVDQDHFRFNRSYYFGKDLSINGTVPTVLDWTVGYGGCSEERMNVTAFACKNNTECYEPVHGHGDGYLCKCSPGFYGNPYIGCQDIDECSYPEKYPCNGTCYNTEGSWSCIQHKPPMRNNGHLVVKIVAVGAGMAFIVLMTGSCLVYNGLRKRRLTNRKRAFFEQNGGLRLQDDLSQVEYAQSAFKIFTAEEMEEATNNFDKARIVGSGGFADVYKGYLSDGTVVAIKKPNSKSLKESENEQFVNEVILLSKIQHQNVVTFLGCCLETEAPLLVYEFIANGTLLDHLHKQGTGPAMPWETRLKIATETAGVLAYLHHDHRPSIIHSDIKPHNILLDDNYTAKVSDFGISKPAPQNETELYTKVKGTLGYLDPEFIQSGQLTEKSDVYSFGVVLLELLTGQKVLHFNRPRENWCLVSYFRSSFAKGCLLETIDKRIMCDENIEQLREVAEIAMLCVSVKAEERPSMKAVAMELGGMLMEAGKSRWVMRDSSLEETQHLLSEACGIHGGNASSSAGYSSGTGDHVMMVPLGDGR